MSKVYFINTVINKDLNICPLCENNMKNEFQSSSQITDVPETEQSGFMCGKQMWHTCSEMIYFYHTRHLQKIPKKIKLITGILEDNDFYNGWNDEPLISYLKLPSESLTKFCCQDPTISYSAIIDNKLVGFSGTAKLNDYKKIIKIAIYAVNSNQTSFNKKLFAKIQEMAFDVIFNWLIKNPPDDKILLYHNSGLLVSREYRGRNIGVELMQHKINELKNSLIFSNTTNKYSSRIIEKVSGKKIGSFLYKDLGIDIDDSFNVYVIKT